MVVLAAGELGSTPLERATRADAFLVLSDEPGSFPVRREEELERDNPRFVVVVPARDQVLSLEVLSRLGIGWHREWLTALPSRGPALSDILLLEAGPGGEVTTMEDAVHGMLASSELDPGAQIGAHFQVYGVSQGVTAEIQLFVEEESGSRVGGWRVLPPQGFEESGEGFSWVLQGDGGSLSERLTLDLSALPGGDYRVVLRARWPGQDWLVRYRTIRIGG
jgi:hypothetical protein